MFRLETLNSCAARVYVFKRKFRDYAVGLPPSREARVFRDGEASPRSAAAVATLPAMSAEFKKGRPKLNASMDALKT